MSMHLYCHPDARRDLVQWNQRSLLCRDDSGV